MRESTWAERTGIALPILLGMLGYAGIAAAVDRLLAPPGVEKRPEAHTTIRPPAERPVVRATSAPPAPSLPAPAPPRAPAPDCPALLTVYFRPGSVAPEQLPLEPVRRLRGWLEAHPEASLLILGHADARGGPRYNWELSYRRARAVARGLQQAGIPSERLSAQAAGSFQPLLGRSETEAGNRRVTLAVLGMPECTSGPAGAPRAGGPP